MTGDFGSAQSPICEDAQSPICEYDSLPICVDGSSPGISPSIALLQGTDKINSQIFNNINPKRLCNKANPRLSIICQTQLSLQEEERIYNRKNETMKLSLSADQRLFFCCGKKTDTTPGKQQIRHGYYESRTALQEPTQTSTQKQTSTSPVLFFCSAHAEAGTRANIRIW